MTETQTIRKNGGYVLPVTVRNRIAVYHAKEKLICGNSSYQIEFDFDSEWNAYPIKTAQFRYLDETGDFVYRNAVFEGTACAVPVISQAETVYVGVYAGDLTTSTEAAIPCWPSALSYGSAPEAADSDVYHAIMEKLNTFQHLNGDKVTPQMFGAAGDGVTDDTEAFLALDGKNAYIPEGVYRVRKCVFHGNTVLRGAGVGKTVIRQLPDVDSDLFVFEDAVQSCLTDLTLEGDGEKGVGNVPVALLKIVRTQASGGAHSVFRNLALYDGPHAGLMLVGEATWDTEYRGRAVRNYVPFLSGFTIARCGGWGMIDESAGNLFSDFTIADNGLGGLLLSHAESNLYSDFKISGAAVSGDEADGLVDVRDSREIRMEQFALSSSLGTGMKVSASSFVHGEGWIGRTGDGAAEDDAFALLLRNTECSDFRMTFPDGEVPYKRNVKIDSDCMDSTVWIDGSCDIPNENESPESCVIIDVRGLRECQKVLSESVLVVPMELTAGQRMTARENLDAAPAIVAEAVGGSIALSDASDGRLRGLRVFGKTTQYGSTGAQLASFLDKAGVTENGIRWRCKNGVITVQGTGSGNAFSNSSAVSIWADIPVAAGTYYISGSTDAVEVIAEITNSNGSVSQKKQTAFTLDGSEVMCAVYCYVQTGSYVSEVIRPMLNRGSEPLPWEPYTDGVAVTKPTPDYPLALETVGSDGSIAVSVDDQQLDVITPNGLPGIPLTLESSVGNYTDASGKRWVCDEIDFERGVYIQRIARKVLNGTESIKAGNTNSFYAEFSDLGWETAIRLVESYCSFLEGSPDGAYNSKKNTSSCAQTRWYLYTSYYADADGVKAYLAEKAAAGTPMEVMYQLATPIETPLSEEQLAAYRELHTNKPTTEVSSDEGAWLSVKYAADPKTYIDNKFNELAAALISHT